MTRRSWLDNCLSVGVCPPANPDHNMSYNKNLTSSLVDWTNRRALETWHNGTEVNRTLEQYSTFEQSLYQTAIVWPTEVVARVITIVVIMALTLLGNTSLIGGICCYASLRRKRVSIFLVNLAIADLMVCAVTMTTEIFFVAFGEWILGAVACKLVVYGQIVTLASTTFLLTAMSIDRYQVLVEPLKSLRGQPKVRRKVQVAWLLAFIFATPQLFIFVQTEEKVSDRTVRACKSMGYSEEWQRKVYFSFLTGYILVIPMAIMSFCYLNIIRTVWMRAGGRDVDQPRVHFVTNRREARRSAAAESTVLSPLCDLKGSVRARQSAVSFGLPNRVISSSKRNVIKMTLSVILGFLVCWTPYFVVSLVRIFSHYRIRLTHVLSVCEIMAMAHSALNPLLYGIFSTRTLRLAAGHLLCRFTRRRIHNVSPDSLSLSEFNHAPLVWHRATTAVNRVSYRTFVSSGRPSVGNSARESNSSGDQRRGTTQCMDEEDSRGCVQRTIKEVPVIEGPARRRTNSREHSSVPEEASTRQCEPSWYRPQSTCDGYNAYFSVQTHEGRQYIVRHNYSASQRANLASSKDSRTLEQDYL